jgi:alkylresorcinol/alkylpyrone synthase
MKIAGVATAFPEHYYSQDDLLLTLKRHWGDRLADVAVLERLHRRLGVEGRHLALPVEQYDTLSTWGAANDTWIQVATELGERATREALARANVPAAAIGTIVFASVTGIASPSIDARLVNRLGLPGSVRRLPLFGLGCVAGAAALSRAADVLRAYPAEAAIVVAVELCSLTWQRDDLSVANLISAGLFADGAASVVLTGADRRGSAGPRICATRSVFYPDTERVMGWHVSERGFRVNLSPDVPGVIREHLGDDVDLFLADAGLRREDIHSWILHPGGPKVLLAATEALGLPAGRLALSWDCLRRVGNLSSVSVLMVLEEVVRRAPPPPGAWSLLAAMGPGFCSELVLLRW